MARDKSSSNTSGKSVTANMAASDTGHSVVLLPPPRRILNALLLVIGLLVVAGIVSSVLKYTLGVQSSFHLIGLFDLDRENNIPTWFSSLLLLSNAILLGLITNRKMASHDRWRWHWCVLAIVFVMLSFDEASAIHENTIQPLRSALGLTGGVLYYTWVVPAAILLLAFAMIYLRFVLALPRRMAWLFVLAASVYISGALGVEMIGGAYVSRPEFNDQVYSLLTICEETLEMIGLAIFVYALTDYIRSNLGSLTLSFRE